MLRRGLLLALAVFAADQLSKWWLIDLLHSTGAAIEVTGFFNLVMVWNRGISFGMFQSGETGRWVLVALTVAICLLIVGWMRRMHRRLSGLGAGLVLGGAVGNLTDRVSPRAAVADFFDVHLMGYHWPAFNVADSAISVGVALIVIDAFCEGRQNKDSATNDS
jgi:signal peptidase II